MSRWRGEGVGEGEGLSGWRGRGSVWVCVWAVSLTGARRAGKGAVGRVVYSFSYSPVKEIDAEFSFWYIPSLYTFAFFNPVHSESLTLACVIDRTRNRPCRYGQTFCVKVV